jgi:hypothetical protein
MSELSFKYSKLDHFPREEYGSDRFRLSNEVREAFFAELKAIWFTNNVNDKKLAKLADYAWQEGHSEGYHRVEEIYEELAELLQGYRY